MGTQTTDSRTATLRSAFALDSSGNEARPISWSCKKRFWRVKYRGRDLKKWGRSLQSGQRRSGPPLRFKTRRGNLVDQNPTGRLRTGRESTRTQGDELPEESPRAGKKWLCLVPGANLDASFTI